MFALRTIVISQIAKVLLLEAADKNLEAPQLTISVYAVFFLSALIGVYFIGKVRLNLPKPLEPTSIDQMGITYTISVTVGIVSTVMYEIYSGRGNDFVYSESRSMALALSNLLFFSMVIAIDSRIRGTGGKHSFGIAAAVPWAVITILSFAEATRTTTIAPFIIY
jgi:hypothetical protein